MTEDEIKKLEKVIENVENNSFFDIFYWVKFKIKKFSFRLKRIIEFIKIGWNDEDWDQLFLLRLLEFKLSKMKEFFENSDEAVSAESKTISEQIKVSLDACSRLIENEYCQREFKEHFEKYPSDSKNTQKKIKEFTEISRKKDELIRKDEENLFDNMKKYYKNWWD